MSGSSRGSRTIAAALVAALASVLGVAAASRPSAAIPPLPIANWVLDSVPIPSQDLAYDATRDVVLATVPYSHAALGNELVELDPETGVVGRHVHVGSDPTTIALSDDGSTAYVALEGASAIAVVDLDDFSVTSFPTTSSPDGPRFALDLEVVPGRNDLVIASLGTGVSFGWSDLVVAYEDGVALPQQISASPAPDRLVMTSATTLFGYESQTSANGQFRLTLGAQGLTSTPVANGPVVGAAADIEFGFGRIYSTYGDIINPTTLAVTAEFAASGLVEVTSDNRLTVVSGNTVSVFNATTGVAVTSGVIGGLGPTHELVATSAGYALAAPGETFLLGPTVAVGDVGLPASPPRTMVEATTAHLPFRVNDLVLDEARGLLYASIAGSSTQRPNQVVALDPATGNVLASVPVVEPGALALSDDGSRLHVGSAVPRTIVTIDPSTFGVIRSIQLGSVFFFGPVLAGDIALAPGTNDTLVVAQVPSSSPSGSTASFALFEGGVLQPSTAVGDTNRFWLAFVDDDDLVAASAPGNRLLRRMHIDEDGVHLDDDTRSMFQNEVGHLEVVDGLVHSASGSVVDPTGPTVHGRYNNTWLTTVSDAPDRVLDVAQGVEGIRVTEFERSTFRRLGDLVLPVSGFPRRAVATPGGLAIGLDGGSLVLVRQPVPTQLRTLAPARLADTRSGFGAPGGALTPAAVRNVQVTGRGGVPASGVTAVVVNLTAVGATASSHLTAWPAGHVRPSTSNVNFQAGAVAANQAIVPVGEGGRISLAAAGGSVHVVVDVQGWFGPSGAPAGSRLNTLAPARLMDSRSGVGTPTGPFAPGVARQLTVTGRGGVPASGVAAVVVNITAVGATASGHLTAWPTGQAQPTTSNVNFRPGVVVANQAIVPVGSGGRISIVAAARTHVVVDVQGWFGAAGAPTGAELRTSSPARIMDSRTAFGTAAGPFAGGVARQLVVTGRGGVPSAGVSAVVVNLTVVGASAQGHLTAWPTGQAQPATSNVNYRPGAVSANQAVVPVGPDGRISIVTAAGTAHVVVDVQGWYGPTS